MAEKKIRFTVIDLLIVLVVLGAIAVAGFKFLPAKMTAANSQVKAVYTVLLTSKEKGFADAMHINDEVSISNKEKDTGVITKIETRTAETMLFDSINGKYITQEIDDKQDIFVTIESGATETDSLIKAGSTPVKVGLEMPVRGKGYASMGYVVAVETIKQGGK